MDGADPKMMEQLMASMGGEGGEGGMDMAKLQAMLGGMGGGMGGMGGAMTPEQEQMQTAQQNQAAAAAKNEGEKEEGADGKTYKWEQTSKYGESEVLVRFTLAAPATKKDVKVIFKAKSLKVTVAGEDLIDGATFGTVAIDDSTWCLVEKGSELQVLLALAEDNKWSSLLA